MDYTSGRSIYESRKKTADDLNSRSYAIGQYLRDNKDAIDSERYESLKTILDDFGKASGQSMYSFYRANQQMEKQYSWHQKYQGSGYKELDAILASMEPGEERDWLAANQYEVYKTAPDFKERSQSGWEEFTENQAKRAASKEEAREEESWFDAIGRYLGTTPDTSLPMAMTSQVTNDLRDDTSYLEPEDDWTDEQRSMYGYLYSISRGAAANYAQQTSENNRSSENEQKLAAIQEWATKNNVNASMGTVAAIAMMPLSLADTLSALTEYNTRGIISTPSTPMPGQVSEAITGSIGQNLNEKHGTINEKIPVFGGKGWGDAYQLGTSIANSILSAYTQGTLGADIVFFGSAASSTMYNAKDRGATDEQAIKLGVLSGLAEVAGETFSIDNLINMSSANTLKAFFGNVLKQSGIEASEEGFTTLLNNFSEQLIMKENSTFYELTRSYMTKEGISEQEAKKRAWLDMAEDLAFDMVGGAISGGTSTAIQTGAVKTYDWFAGSEQNQTHHVPLESKPGKNDSMEGQEAEDTITDETIGSTEESTVVGAENATTTEPVTLEALSQKYGQQAKAMEGQDLEEYDRAFQMAYNMGKAGVSAEYVRTSEATSYLSESQREIAYEIGAAAAANAAKEQAGKNTAAANGKTGWRKGTVKGQGVKIADMSKAFNDPQRKAYKYLSNIAEVTGVDIVLYKSEVDSQGNYQGAQGKFKWNEDTIYIDKMPTNLLAILVSMVMTLVAFFAYVGYTGMVYAWYHVAAAVVVAFMVAYAAMFGFDKLKEALSKVKELGE